MSEIVNEISPELIQLLRAAGEVAAGERRERWAQAFEDWLEERGTRFSARARADSQRAWQEFLALTGKAPWEATTADVEAYVEALTARGLGAGTITKRLTGLADFYRHCQEKEVDPACGAAFNPAREARRPKVIPYEKANSLSEKEEARLLEAVRRDPSALGKRDHALILALLRTGRKAGEVRRLTWGEFKGDPSMPEEVREAARACLEAAGRLEGIRDEEYVFAPSKAPLIREAGKRAEDWDGSRPLSDNGLRKLVQLHARRAGLKAEAINCHTLRHTAAMRAAEAGGTPEAVKTLLGRSSTAETKKYLRRLGKRPKGRLTARRRVKAEPREGEALRRPFSRGPRRAGARNHLGLKHGLYAKHLPELERLAEQGVELEGVEREIFRWRTVMRRALAMTAQPITTEEGIRALKAAIKAARRSAQASLLRTKLREAEGEGRMKDEGGN